MDAYDHIQEEALSPEEKQVAETPATEDESVRPTSSDLNTEIRETYKAFMSSSWGMKLGDFLGSVKKQGEPLYEGARKEFTAASSQASKNFNELLSHTKPLSTDELDAKSSDDVPKETKAGDDATTKTEVDQEIPESLPADIVKEAQSMYSTLRSKAAERLKQFEKAEDAADEALLKFGTNIRNFLREAVTIAPPSEEGDATKSSVLFESKDTDGRRVVHATRFDAQLHVIHSTISSFTQDPQSEAYKNWKETFDVEKQTSAISKDLEKYVELRRAMEKLVPESVEYPEFWTRYYFLRHVVETEEQKRRELLKGSQEVDEEQVGWDDEDEDEDNVQTPNISKLDLSTKAASGSNKRVDNTGLLKPIEPRRSNEHSVADSDASYDIVSGATSRTPGSPRDDKEAVEKRKKTKPVAEESDEDDWE